MGNLLKIMELISGHVIMSTQQCFTPELALRGLKGQVKKHSQWLPKYTVKESTAYTSERVYLYYARWENKKGDLAHTVRG